MRLSARNQLEGKIVGVAKGRATARARIDIRNGTMVTASVINEAADELGLAAGQDADAIVKASDVLVAVD